MSRRSKKQTVSKATRKAIRRANRKVTRKAASTAPVKDASTTASRTVSKALCHFLRIPKEMRLKIYGYLFLYPPRAALHPMEVNYVAKGDRFNKSSNGYNGHGPLGLMGDISDPPSSIPTDHHEYQTDDRGFYWFKRIHRHLAILRTNRQIYHEASALLHLDLAIDVNPGDAVRLIPRNVISKQIRDAWRHDPSKSLGFTDTNGQRVYESGLLDRILEPHIFARFEKVSYHADFCFKYTRTAPRLQVNDDLSVRAKDGAKFVSYLTTAKSTTRWFEDPISGRSNNHRRETLEDVAGITISSVTNTEPSTAEIVQDFVDLLSNSPLIRHLEVILNLDVRHKDIKEVLTIRISDYDLDSEEEARDVEKAKVANERATELFLESSVLESLGKLSNVKCFSLKVATKGRGDEIMTPRQKHLNIIRDLKEVIEKNWVVKNGPH